MIPPPHAQRLAYTPPPAGADPHYVHLFKVAVSTISVAWMWITPADARYILEHHNKRNRPMRSSWRLLRQKILSFLFRGDNGETGIFDRDGNILSLQHRLNAIAEGEQPVFVLCVFGVDPDAFDTLDQAIRRRASDVLALLGQKNASTLAAALNWAQRYCGRGVDHGAWVALPNEEVDDVLRAFPTMPESVLWAKSKTKRGAKLIPPALLAFLHYALNENDPDAAPRFLEQVIDGVEVIRHSWPYILRRRLQEDFTGAIHFPDMIELAALFFKAFNYDRAGRTVIVPVRGGKEIEPSIIWRGDQNEPFPELNPPSSASGAA